MTGLGGNLEFGGLLAALAAVLIPAFGSVGSDTDSLAAARGATPAQVALAWTIRQDGVIAIPKAVDPRHVQLNAAAGGLSLSAADLQAIDQAFADGLPEWAVLWQRDQAVLQLAAGARAKRLAKALTSR